MSVIPLTIFFSLLLAGLFIVLFANEQRRRRFTSAESDSLLPLAEEQAREVPSLDHHQAHEQDHADHPHNHSGHAHGDNCGCKTGKRAPCPGCVKRPDRATTL